MLEDFQFCKISSRLCCVVSKERFFHENKQTREDLADINMSCNVRGGGKVPGNFLHVAKDRGECWGRKLSL